MQRVEEKFAAPQRRNALNAVQKRALSRAAGSTGLDYLVNRQ